MAKTNQPAVDSENIKKGIPMEDEDDKKPTPEEEKAALDAKQAEEKKAADDKAAADKAEADKKAADNVAQGLNPDGTKKEDKTPPQSRPEKYIPVEKYTNEKRQWKETEAQKDARIAELEKVAAGKEGTKANEAAIAKYAEKHGLDVDTARAEIERVRDAQELFNGDKKPETAPEKKAELTEQQQKDLKEAQELKAEKAFNQEYKDVAVPELKQIYPNATPEQLEAAKEEIGKLATTETFLDKTLDFVVFKNRKALDKIFTDQSRKGPESSRQAPSRNTQITIDHFKDGQNFADLATLSADERNKLVEQMPSAMWTKYKNWVKANTELEVS